MSLSKQLLILISVLFLIIFSVNFLLSVSNIRSYLEGEAEVHAQDTATSLGLSLSPYLADEKDPVIKTMMNAIFDMGYYQEIKLVNLEGKSLVTLTNNNVFEGVPNWFVDNITMQTATAKSEVNSGWMISGVLHVTTSPGYAYMKLYDQVKNSFYVSLIAFVISIGLLFLVLRITLSSLKRIGHMALTIAEGRFENISPLPWTTEVKHVALSMNVMSNKIEGAISNLNSKLERIGKQLQQDDLTGLNKKASFEVEIKKLFLEKSAAYVFMIKIDGLSNLVKERGEADVDQFLKDFATVLTQTSEEFHNNEITCYRFYGSEFALLMKHGGYEQAEKLAEQLSVEFARLGKQYQKMDIVHIGITQFNEMGSSSDILLAANEAYEQAQLIGANSFFIRQSEDKAKDISEWKSLVFDVVDNEKYQLSFVGKVESFETGAVLMEDAFTQVVDENGGLVSIGTFVSIAEKFVKIVDLDKGVTAKVVDYINENNLKHSVAISLSTRTIKSSDFRSWLVRLLKQNQAISSKLVFSLSAYAVAKEVSVYREFMAFVHQLGAKVIIKRFETQSMSSDVVTSLKPDYIRLARDLSKDIANIDAKKDFVQTMKEIGDLSNINILAENVYSESDFLCIKEIGISGASR